MNPVFDFVLIVIGMAFVFTLLKQRMGLRDRRDQSADQDNGENQRLREEVADLKDRLAVLERITVEKENSLAKEIESLRDR